MHNKIIIGDPIVIGGRTLSLSRAVQAGDYVFMTGQLPFENGELMTTGSIETQTRAVLDEIKSTLELAGCELSDIVKTTVWLQHKEDFPGFDAVYHQYFPVDPPARSALVNQLLVDSRVEVEAIAYHPQHMHQPDH